jgi:hypothetical protein
MMTFNAAQELGRLCGPLRFGRWTGSPARSRGGAGVCATVAVVAVLALGAAGASAAVPSPGFTVDSVASPTNFTSSAGGAYEVEVRNAGSVESAESDPVVIEDVVPKGLSVGTVEPFKVKPGAEEPEGLVCETVGSLVTCRFAGALKPDEALRVVIHVGVIEPEASPLTNNVKVSGGGAVDVAASSENRISSAPPPFGPANFDFDIAGQDGARDAQAGDHPYELTTTIDLNSVVENQGRESFPHITGVEDLKDVVVDLPLGFAGSTLAAPECPLSRLPEGHCPPDTVVGHIRTVPRSAASVYSAIWNLVPERGVPAEFGFEDATNNTHVFYAHVVPTPAGYVLQATSTELPQIVFSRVVLTLFGDPAAKQEELARLEGREAGGEPHIPFFTDPTACEGGALKATIHMDSWEHPGRFNPDGTPDLGGDPNWKEMTSTSPPVTGCDELQFTPALFAQPTTHQADTPSGLEFELGLPQTEDSAVHATPALKNAAVTLPSGMTVDPSAGNGLQACSVAQIGWEGGSPFNFNPDPPQCPEASKIGSLELESPLIRGTLRGAIYLAAQNENPFGSTLATYVVVDDPVTGVLLKIAGELKADPATGQITSVFPENPQLPFSDLKLHFFGGPRASLATPNTCGTFTTTSDLTPWSAPDSGPDGMPFDSFVVNEGCVSGFSPAFVAGTTNLQAGAFTPFVASFSRSDQDQELGGLTLTMPPGLLADIANVPECPEAQANAGTCPEDTQIGTVQSEAGPGPNPLSVTGKAYFTGPYNGGPYGLSVVVPAVAGPFNFGNVVVRQSLRIDPHTAQVTDVSDPFPTILDPIGANGQTDGIPIKLRRVDVDINRPNFTFNPTSCSKLQVGGTISSDHGASSTLATPFQVTNCASLKFAPKFAVSVAAHTSKVAGAALTTKLAYPNAPQGTYANIAKVKVDLPIQLPSQLKTLQKACLAAVFEANPAGCRAESIVGHAIVHTPLLPLPLSGPAYFVSHGGEAFPSLTIVLQGNGVTVDLVGSTFVKKGITSTTFKTLPDTPFSTFELTLPQGKYAALAANLPAKAKGSFCGQNLKMPTLFVAQNGLEIHQQTPIAITGCPKAKKPRHAKKTTKGHGRKKP